MKLPKEIYNEGRVVGFSAYEIYVRHVLSEDPNATPASEQEWLASFLKTGSSMLLRISNISSLGEGIVVTDYNPTVVRNDAAETADGEFYSIIDVPLPENCNLVAANTIYASFFNGVAEFEDNSPWATNILSYGQLLLNKEAGTLNGIGTQGNRVSGSNAASPDLTTSSSTGTPVQTTISGSQNDITQFAGLGYNNFSPVLGVMHQVDSLNSSDIDIALEEYSHYVDGVVIQPANWVEYEDSDDWYATLAPSFSDRPSIRLLYQGTSAISGGAYTYILLSGFSYEGTLPGMIGMDGSIDTAAPQNGDFLGPAVFPWANKIIFNTPNLYIRRILENRLNKVPTWETLDSYFGYTIGTMLLDGYVNSTWPIYHNTKRVVDYTSSTGDNIRVVDPFPQYVGKSTMTVEMYKDSGSDLSSSNLRYMVPYANPTVDYQITACNNFRSILKSYIYNGSSSVDDPHIIYRDFSATPQATDNESKNLTLFRVCDLDIHPNALQGGQCSLPGSVKVKQSIEQVRNASGELIPAYIDLSISLAENFQSNSTSGTDEYIYGSLTLGGTCFSTAVEGDLGHNRDGTDFRFSHGSLTYSSRICNVRFHNAYAWISEPGNYTLTDVSEPTVNIWNVQSLAATSDAQFYDTTHLNDAKKAGYCYNHTSCSWPVRLSARFGIEPFVQNPDNANVLTIFGVSIGDGHNRQLNESLNDVGGTSEYFGTTYEGTVYQYDQYPRAVLYSAYSTNGLNSDLNIRLTATSLLQN